MLFSWNHFKKCFLNQSQSQRLVINSLLIGVIASAGINDMTLEHGASDSPVNQSTSASQSNTSGVNDAPSPAQATSEQTTNIAPDATEASASKKAPSECSCQGCAITGGQKYGW